MSNKVELHKKVLHALQGRYLVYFVYLCYFERLCILDIQFVRPGKDMSFSTIFLYILLEMTIHTTLSML